LGAVGQSAKKPHGAISEGHGKQCERGEGIDISANHKHDGEGRKTSQSIRDSKNQPAGGSLLRHGVRLKDAMLQQRE
jgi:hypothetical protein